MRCKDIVEAAKKQRDVAVGMMLLDAAEEVNYLRSLLVQWYEASLEVSDALGSSASDKIEFAVELLADIEEIMTDEAREAQEAM